MQLLLLGRPANLDYSRTGAYCACSGCGWGCLEIFSLIYHFSFLSPSLWETARYRLKYCLKGPLSPKQPTNQPTNLLLVKIFSANLGQGARKRVFLISHHLILRPLFVCPGKLTSIDASLKKKEALFFRNANFPEMHSPERYFFLFLIHYL